MADVASSGQLQEFLRVLRRRRWQIVMPAIFVLALGTVFAVLVPKLYVISTRVELLEGIFTQSISSSRERVGSAVQREVQNVAHHLGSYTRIKRVVEEQSNLWPAYMTADAEGKRKWIERIQGNLDVSQIEKRRNEGSTFVDIEYRDVDGERAVKFLEDLIDKWVREVVEAEKNTTLAELENFDEACQETLLAKREANNDFNRLARDMGIDPTIFLGNGTAKADTDTIHVRVSEAELQRLEAQTNRAAAVEEHAVSLENFEAAEPFILEDLEAKLFALREKAEASIAKLEIDRENKKPTSQFYRLAQRRIDGIRTLLEAAEQRLTEERPSIPNPELPRLRLEELEARKQVRITEARLLEIDGRITDLINERDRSIDLTNELIDLRDILDQKTAANAENVKEYERIKRQLIRLESSPDPYRINREPVVEGSPTEPNSIVLVLLSAFAGLALGLSIAMAAEYARNSYRTVADVSHILAIPVLGTVDQIVTSMEARRLQARRALVGLSSAVILGGLAWFTWIWDVSPSKLPIQVTELIDKFRTFLM